MAVIGILLRAVTYSTLFIGFLLVYLPSRTLARAGIARTIDVGVPESIGAVITLAGAALALSCIATFAFVGRGTPAPFDPPRRLVVRGPYRYLRNPMYLGAGLALFGAALFYGSAALATYALVFLLVMHLFVIAYEEPSLRRTFGDDYRTYCRHVRRWLPGASRYTPIRSDPHT
jgi:protein-S-isoprenylcysteine O-methyltransferase Ste14